MATISAGATPVLVLVWPSRRKFSVEVARNSDFLNLTDQSQSHSTTDHSSHPEPTADHRTQTATTTSSDSQDDIHQSLFGAKESPMEGRFEQTAPLPVSMPLSPHCARCAYTGQPTQNEETNSSTQRLVEAGYSGSGRPAFEER
jgi:hypothetical protein